MGETAFIINPQSASGKTGRRWPKLALKVSQRFNAPKFFFTESAGDGERLAREAFQSGAQTVVAVGGDGTMNEVLNGYFDTTGAVINPEASLGVLPMGTGSDLCRSVGVSRDPVEALSLLSEPPSHIDCGLVEVSEQRRYFGNIGSVGVSGEVAKYFEEHGKTGALSYISGLFKAASNYQKRGFSLRFKTLDGEVVEREIPDAFISIFAKGRYFGGGMKIAPKSMLTNGSLQCVLVRGVSGLEIMRYLPSIFAGKHLKHPPFSSLIASEVELSVTHDSWIELDGEPALKVTPEERAIIKVLPSRVLFHLGSEAYR